MATPFVGCGFSSLLQARILHRCQAATRAEVQYIQCGRPNIELSFFERDGNVPRAINQAQMRPLEDPVTAT